MARTGRPPAQVEPHLVQDIQDTVLIDKFLEIPEFAECRPEAYTREQMISACMGYVLTGSNSKASKISGIPSNNIRQWRHSSNWWLPCEALCREILSERLEDKFTGLLNETLSQLERRLSKGDVIHRDGNIVNVPVKASELGRILSVLFDKRQLLRGDVTSRSESKNTNQDLDKLKKAAEEVVKSAADRVDITDTGT